MKDARNSLLEMSGAEFRNSGYELVDAIANFIESIRTRPVTRGESSEQIRQLLEIKPIPENGLPPDRILTKAAQLLFEHSLLNGHPRFLGYITSSAAPLGALADLLAAAVNPNAGAQILSPVATEIELQTVNWIANLVGLPSTYGGLLVSGGNMANFTGFLAGRRAKASAHLSEDGLKGISENLLVYCSSATHTWIEKAAILFGMGKKSIRWIDTNDHNQMDIDKLNNTIQTDLQEQLKPIMVIGTAGDVSTGAVDDFNAIAALCKKYNLWFHIDGAYGLPGAAIPALSHLFSGMEEADSLALDPHKWLYSPLEAGCVLVKDEENLRASFSSHPAYYNFGDEKDSVHNFYEYGLQNSRGFRALKVWICLQQAGRQGYIQMISDDIALSRLFAQLADNHPELESVTQNLSITTLRYIPLQSSGFSMDENFLNQLNEFLLNRLQQKGETFLSNAVIKGKYCLRGCIVNFRTSEKDIYEIIEIIVREGRASFEILKDLANKQ